MEEFPEDSYYLQCMKTILDAYPQHSPPVHPTRLTDQLYIGNQDNADDVSLLSGLEITHVLNCAGTRTFDLRRSPYPPDSGIKGFLMIPAYDFDDFDIMQFFEDAIGFLDNATGKGGKVLVHCSIGVNRSGAIVAAYMMINQKKRLLDVVVELKAKRLLILCNMGFRKQLVQFARSKGLLDRPATSAKKQPDSSPVQPQNEVAPTKEGDEKCEASQEVKTSNGEIHDQDGEAAEPPPSPKADEAATKKYIYKTKSFVPEVKAPTHSTSGASRSYKNVDPDIVVKVINESYDKYKQSSRMKDYKTPLEIKASLATCTLPQQQRHMKKSAEKELAREVEDFLSDKVAGDKNLEMSSLLNNLISKEDERLIWGKGSLEDDPKYQLYKENLERSHQASLNKQSVLQSAQPTHKGSKPLDLVRKYQDTTNNEIFRNLQDLVTPSKKSFVARSPAADFSKLRGTKVNQELDNEVEEYLKKRGTYTAVLPALEKTLQNSMSTKESADEVLRRISSSQTSFSAKPLSFYRLQVLTENKQSGP